MLDGRRVTSRDQWFKERRPELKALFQHYMYGAIPPKPAHVQVRILGEYHDFLGGKATLKLVRLETGPAKAPQIDLMLVVPNERPGPAPVFLAMDFCGNHALTADPRVPLARSWLGNCVQGLHEQRRHRGRPRLAGCRLAPGRNRPARLRPGGVLQRGRGSRPQGGQRGHLRLAGGGDPARNNPTNRGTIAAWAWGFHRCVDYLVTEPGVDAHRIAALGHSRNGKTALLAAAFDERIAIAFPHQAGCGGSAPSRGKTGESVKAINDHFPHWFNAQFKQFNDAPERLPFDQNCLVALCAPRPVLFSAAEGDQWANPAGQFQVLQAADPVYRFLGTEGLAAKEMPPRGQLVASPLGYYVREGKHSMTADDWTVFMNFADSQWRK